MDQSPKATEQGNTNGETHVTRRELALELKSFRNEVRVLMAIGVVVLKFNVPSEITAGAIVVACGAAVFKGFAARFFASH